MSETQDNQKSAEVDAQRPPLSDLLTCPFCGEAPHVTSAIGNYGPRISCHNSSCRLGHIVGSFSVADWNTRAS